MKKMLFFLFSISLWEISTAQVSLVKATQNHIEIVYHNDSSFIAYFSNPVFHAKQDKGSFWLRNDMYSLINDTLFLYLTDTVLSYKRFSKIYKFTDSLSKKIGFQIIDSLPPRYYVRYRLRFLRKINYNYLAIKYNFGYKKEDFFNPDGIPVEMILQRRSGFLAH